MEAYQVIFDIQFKLDSRQIEIKCWNENMLIIFLPWFVQLPDTDVMVIQSRIQNIVTETGLIGTCVIVALYNSLRREDHVL